MNAVSDDVVGEEKKAQMLAKLAELRTTIDNLADEFSDTSSKECRMRDIIARALHEMNKGENDRNTVKAILREADGL